MPLQKDDPKFRTIKTDNSAYQTRVAAIRGGKKFLLSAGFVENEDEGVLVRIAKCALQG